jgi:hypothetical protein
VVEQIEAMSLGQVKPLNWADECWRNSPEETDQKFLVV